MASTESRDVHMNWMRRLYGEDVARATMVSDILASVASGLSGDPSDLHRRCVFVEELQSTDMCPVFAPFGAVEAVAVCYDGRAKRAVVVFCAAADAARALQGPPGRQIGRCLAVPPLDLARPRSFISPTDVEVELNPSTSVKPPKIAGEEAPRGVSPGSRNARMLLMHMHRVYGEDRARATIVRNILAPVACRLSGDPYDLHRRCVLVEDLQSTATHDVRLVFAPFGTIEAVAVWDGFAKKAVVVFCAAADAARALEGPPMRQIGRCQTVPPLDLGRPHNLISPAEVKVEFSPSSAMPVGQGASGGASSHPTGDGLPEPRPLIKFHDPSVERCGVTIRFEPSLNSETYGPTLGADGHMWMDGITVTSYEYGMQVIDHTSIRVKLLDPQPDSAGRHIVYTHAFPPQ